MESSAGQPKMQAQRCWNRRPVHHPLNQVRIKAALTRGGKADRKRCKISWARWGRAAAGKPICQRASLRRQKRSPGSGRVRWRMSRLVFCHALRHLAAWAGASSSVPLLRMCALTRAGVHPSSPKWSRALSKWRMTASWNHRSHEPRLYKNSLCVMSSRSALALDRTWRPPSLDASYVATRKRAARDSSSRSGKLPEKPMDRGSRRTDADNHPRGPGNSLAIAA
eukprot:443671-Pyramimonas_sp.AAC.1